MINIEKYYKEEEEVRKNTCMYDMMYKTFRGVFDFSKLESFIDLGCATGHLIDNIKKKHPRMEVVGVEYFAYHKESKYCSSRIKDSIIIDDLRKPIKLDKKFDIVYSTEVGEHIDPIYADTYIQNIKNLAKDVVILSWAGGYIWSQHFNPMEYDEFIWFCKCHGLEKDEKLSKKILSEMERINFNHRCYKVSITAFRVKKDVSPPWNAFNLVGKIEEHSGDKKITLRKAMVDVVGKDFDVLVSYEIESDYEKDDFPYIRHDGTKYTKKEFVLTIGSRDLYLIMPSKSKYKIIRMEIFPIDKDIKKKLHL